LAALAIRPDALREGWLGRVQAGAMFNPFQFIQEARAEGAKVTWPSRRETLITTGLVIVMVIITSLFFLAVDYTMRLIVTFMLSFGH
jgi:preprotein translocase subunit SecE